MKFTLAHVTHEAVEHIGGIGTVLHGFMTSPVYQGHVRRSILVGPTSTEIAVEPEARLGEHGRVIYSSVDKIDHANLGTRLRPIEGAFKVRIVYGTRTYQNPMTGQDGEAEILLIDVFGVNHDRLNVFKLRLWETFGLDSSRYEGAWDYEEYVRLAEPAHYALRALMTPDDLPCIVMSHEFMGMPTALATILDSSDQFRSIFYAHECATARRIVEDHQGHDTMFYNVLYQARNDGLFLEDVFGSQDHLLRHALVRRSHLCDGVIAVGDRTRDELLFLHDDYRSCPVDLVFNGVPSGPVTLEEKRRSRARLAEYAQRLVGFKPEVLMTHVTRPVISKGLWRDLKVCHELDHRFAPQNRTFVLFVLTSGGGVRREQDVLAMERHYGWPVAHHPGYPDLVGPEVQIHEDIDAYNHSHTASRIILVNQFGWSPQRIGSRLPEGMTMTDLRLATDVEFGMATYEPFGISPLEPLGTGAICVISNVCGCRAFVENVSQGQGGDNVICADFTSLRQPLPIEELTAMTQQQRDDIEDHVAAEVADQLLRRLPINDRQRATLIDSGQALVAAMGWDHVVGSSLVPAMEHVVTSPRPDTMATA